ncbi:hypothetical protein [Natrinema sp. SYSU A 869]|uniref:hypothetical protein n=1 Tax=Natrinema sp. SYSU A 869 TaxID=2871694 RepID=UPI001CA3E336|nr:hypothetical protein [Natrinema sp. SYSU A 869]
MPVWDVGEATYDPVDFTYQDPNPNSLNEIENEYTVSILGFDEEEGYNVEPHEVHRDYDNRFIGVSHFEHSNEYECEYSGITYTGTPNPREVHYDFVVEEDNQRHTTFSQYHPNDTDKESLEQDYNVTFGASIGYEGFSIGVSISNNDDNVNFTPYDSLNYALPANDKGNLPTGSDKLYGFETDIDSDLSGGESVQVSLSSEFDYSVGCHSRTYLTTPEATAYVTLSVVE